MKRRDFSTGLITSGLAAPALIRPGNVWASEQTPNQHDETGGGPDQFVRMQLLIGTQAVVITWLILMLPALIGLNFQRTVLRYPLARANLGVLLLGLQRPPIRTRFANALLFGTIYLLGSLLLVLPLISLTRGLGQTSIANSGYEFAHPGRPRSVKIQGLPSPTQLALLDRIGEVYLNEKGELALIIDPVDADLPFRRSRREVDRLIRQTWRAG